MSAALPPPPDTIVAIATAPGRGAIGIVRLSGPRASEIVETVVGRTLNPRHATRAIFRGGEGEALDDGLALFFPAPASYTGEAVVELQAHGGPAVLRLLQARCVELGARLAAPGEYTRRAFLNGRIDLAQAEGVADLIDAATGAAARAAARSLTGEFSRAVNAVAERVTELRALTEATLDFPEEEIDFLTAAGARAKLAALAGELATLLDRAGRGARLREGITVVLAGRPNVGKSSLLNALAGHDAAIVTPVPGTTRDPVERGIEVGGIPLNVIDTAGLRATDDPVESIGIERAWSAIGSASAALVVVEAQRDGAQLAPGDRAILARLPRGMPRLILHNKIDLARGAIGPHVEERPATPAGPAVEGEDTRTDERHVYLSAATGEGVDLLRAELLAICGATETTEDTFLARERHLVALREARAGIAAARAILESAAPPLEILAFELRAAHRALGGIVGEFSADDLLGVIFSRFCIGK